MRGKRLNLEARSVKRGITPADAGKTERPKVCPVIH